MEGTCELYLFKLDAKSRSNLNTWMLEEVSICIREEVVCREKRIKLKRANERLLEKLLGQVSCGHEMPD